jgi:L-rhamnose mutarotase
METPMQRLAFTMQLKPGCAAAYEERHKAIWPELTQVLREAGITEYSIFLDHDTDTLFAFQKVTGTGSSQDLKDDPVVRRWWDHMADLMATHPDNSPVSRNLREVFFLK